MNKIVMRKTGLALTCGFATLLTIALIGSSVASSYSTQIDSFLNITNRSEITGTDTSVSYYTAKYKTAVEVKTRAEELCAQVEGEGLTLLKTTGEAPIKENDSVSLFGNGSVKINCSAQGQRNATDVDYEDMKTAFENNHINVNETLWNFYKNSSSVGSLNSINETPWSRFTPTVKSSFGDFGDCAVMVITRDSIEGSDVKANGTAEEIDSGVVGTDGTYISLSKQERETLSEISKLKAGGTFKKVVVLLNSALTMNLDFLEDETILVDECLWIGNTGMNGIDSVAKALLGTINPSGKLSDTYVYDNFSAPSAQSWKANGKTNLIYENDDLTAQQKYYSVYNEGIYVGYRYYETRYADVVEGREGAGQFEYDEVVARPFGYGDSYTQFDYSNYQVVEDGSSYKVSLSVKNVGSKNSGKETVQIYLQKPYTDYAKKNGMEVSAVDLVGFDKTASLAPGESTTLSIDVPKESFASFDTYCTKSYLLDSGDYYLSAGKNAHDALNNILARKGYSTLNGMDDAGDASLSYKITVDAQDKETYAKSSITGNDIKARLDDIDANTNTDIYDSVTYVSRDNWEETFPVGATKLTYNKKLGEALNNLTIDDIASSEEALPTYGKNPTLTLIQLRGKDYSDKDWETLLDQMTFDEQNTLITLALKTQAIDSVIKPETIHSDGPTLVKDTTSGYEDSTSRFPCEGIWASSFNKELVGEIGELLANDCICSGIDGLWGCGVNLHRSPFGGRAHEYFSEDPYLTGVMAENEIKALQSYGIIAGPKHFAINDQEENRSGAAVWLNEQAAREIYLSPWKYVVAPNHGNAHTVMSSFNRIGARWSSANEDMIDGVLREEFGFDGYVLTDLASGNGSSYMTELDGLMGGTDAWLNYSSDTFSFEPYKDNATVANRMRESCHRILYVTCNYSIKMNGFSTNTKIVYHTAWYEALLTALIVVSAVLTVGSLFLYEFGKYKAEK